MSLESIYQQQNNWWKKQQATTGNQYGIPNYNTQQQYTPTEPTYQSTMPTTNTAIPPLDLSSIMPTAPTQTQEQGPEWNDWLMNNQSQAMQIRYTPFIAVKGRFL